MRNYLDFFIQSFIVFIILNNCVGAEVINGTNDELLNTTVILGTNSIIIGNIPLGSSHILFQIHSPFKPLCLSYTKNYRYDTSKNGSHVGLVSMASKSGPSPQKYSFYIISNYTSPMTVWFKVKAFKPEDPIPGGCSDESNLDQDPNLTVRPGRLGFSGISSDWLLNVDFSLGSVWGGKAPVSCENRSVWPRTTYYLYAFPLVACGSLLVNGERVLDTLSYPITRESVAERLNDMTSPIKLMQNADRLALYTPEPRTQTMFTLVRHVGTAHIVAMVMEYQRNPTTESTFAAYVPTVVYGCDGDLQDKPADCYLMPGFWFSLFSVFLIVLGVVFAGVGHRFPITQGLLCLSLLGIFIILAAVQNSNGGLPTSLWFGLIGGVFVPLVLLMVLCVCKCFEESHRLKVFPSAVLVSFLLIAALFFSPVRDIPAFQQMNYFIAFVAVVSVLPLFFFMPFYRLCLCFSTSVIGLYVALLGISISFLPGCLFHYILIDQYLRLALPSFLGAINYGPLGMVDVVLLLVWSVMSILSTIITYRILPKPQPTNRPPTRTSGGHVRLMDDSTERYGSHGRTVSMESSHVWFHRGNGQVSGVASETTSLYDRHETPPQIRGSGRINYGTTPREPPTAPPAYSSVAVIAVIEGEGHR